MLVYIQLIFFHIINCKNNLSKTNYYEGAVVTERECF